MVRRKMDNIQKFYTQEEFEERQKNWKPHLGLHLLWTWWDVKDFFGELSYYLRKLLRIIERRFLNRNRSSKTAFIDCDSWSLNYSIAELIIYGIKDIRKRGIGYPVILTGMEYRFSGIAEWHEILLTIQVGFEEWIKLHESEYKHGSEEKKQAQEKVEKAFDLLKEYFDNLWD